MSSGLSAKFLITGFAIDISDSLSTMHTFYDTGGTAARHVGLSHFKFGILYRDRYKDHPNSFIYYEFLHK